MTYVFNKKIYPSVTKFTPNRFNFNFVKFILYKLIYNDASFKLYFKIHWLIDFTLFIRPRGYAPFGHQEYKCYKKDTVIQNIIVEHKRTQVRNIVSLRSSVCVKFSVVQVLIVKYCLWLRRLSNALRLW